MELQEGRFTALGTDILVSLPKDDFDSKFHLVQTEALRIEHKFSRFIKDSELSWLNAQLNQWVPLDAEWLYVLENFMRLAEACAPHLSLGTTELLEHWGYNADYDLKADAAATAFKPLKLDLKANAIRINQPLDFGCFGKGYFLDQARALLKKQGISEFVINAGGDLTCAASEALKFYLEDPRVNRRYIGECFLTDGFLCASAANRRQWGKFHHLIELERQAPAQSMQAVFVQSNTSGFLTDALSTAYFVAGFKAVPNLYDRLTAANLSAEVLGISATGKIWRSHDFNATLFTH